MFPAGAFFFGLSSLDGALGPERNWDRTATSLVLTDVMLSRLVIGYMHVERTMKG
jgi:hypothetical protein